LPSHRLAFINKLDRMGANPWKVIKGLRTVLALNAAAVQVPIGLEDGHEGVVDLVEGCCYYCRGDKGRDVVREEGVPAHLQALVDEKRAELIERLADVDDEVGSGTVVFLCCEGEAPIEGVFETRAWCLCEGCGVAAARCECV
jgi:translation elongation factor EF-G